MKKEDNELVQKLVFRDVSDLNYVRPYELSGENILDFLLNYNDVTSEEIRKYIGCKGGPIRRTIAKMINRTMCKFFIIRKRVNGVFRYYSVSEYNPKEAYKIIMNSPIEKVTINQNGIKHSPLDLPYSKKVFPNVMVRLKKYKAAWKTICEIAEELKVNDKKGKKAIGDELKRCERCLVQFIEVKKEDGVKKYRLRSKYRKHTVEELLDIAKLSFPRPEDKGEIKSIKIQAINGVLENV